MAFTSVPSCTRIRVTKVSETVGTIETFGAIEAIRRQPTIVAIVATEANHHSPPFDATPLQMPPSSVVCRHLTIPPDCNPSARYPTIYPLSLCLSLYLSLCNTLSVSLSVSLLLSLCLSRSWSLFVVFQRNTRGPTGKWTQRLPRTDVVGWWQSPHIAKKTTSTSASVAWRGPFLSPWRPPRRGWLENTREGLFVECSDTAASWKHCIDYNTTSAWLDVSVFRVRTVPSVSLSLWRWRRSLRISRTRHALWWQTNVTIHS